MPPLSSSSPLTIRPSAAPDRELDLTHALVSAVAQELWRHHGGNDVLNWLEAEEFVQSLGRVAAHAALPRHPPRVRKKRSLPRVEEPRFTGPLPV